MSKIREILDNLSTEQYKMMIGEKSCQPLTETFSKKRVVHPGANGQNGTTCKTARNLA